MFIPKYRSEFRVPSSELFFARTGASIVRADPGTLNPEPGTGGPEPETRNLEPGTLIPERRKSVGLSLVELIVFIVIVSTAVAGVLGVLSIATRGSADPMIQKQALSIAEAVLEEVQLQPFTYCDPNDVNAATATSAAGCAATAEGLGPEAVDQPPTGPAETRTGVVRPFDNVNDYNTFSMTGMTDISGTPITGLGAYTVVVGVAGQAFAAFGGGRAISVADSLLVTVTVTGPGNTTAVVHGYRVRYVPNALP
jgi:MSHA pilin protein MshD